MADFWIGTSGWTYDHWKGNFYPATLAKARWFGYYASQFAAVEINATFYRTFADSTYLKWRDQVGKDFRYVLKVPRLITHERYLENCAAELQAFWRSAALLEDRLGMVLLQVAPDMPCDLGRLGAAVQSFGDPGRVAVEFRASCWQTIEVRQLLAELGAVTVYADSPRSPLPDLSQSQQQPVGKRAYLRLHGRSHWYASDYSLRGAGRNRCHGAQPGGPGSGRGLYLLQ